MQLHFNLVSAINNELLAHYQLKRGISLQGELKLIKKMSSANLSNFLNLFMHLFAQHDLGNAEC